MPHVSPRRPFRIGRSKTGLGLFATRPIDKGTLIIKYWGRRLSNKEADEIDNRYLFELNSRWTIDGSSRRNTARYINHSCRPNAESDVVKGEILITAIRNIKPGDEITYDYGKEHFNGFIKAKGCRCVKCTEQRAAARRNGAANGKRSAHANGAAKSSGATRGNGSAKRNGAGRR
jgi:SET domain-containing protein